MPTLRPSSDVSATPTDLSRLIIGAVIKAIIDKTDGLHCQVDFGNEQTAFISERQEGLGELVMLLTILEMWR